MTEQSTDTHIGDAIYVDLKNYALDLDDEAALIAEQDECTFSWLTKDGSPMSAIMSYLRTPDGKFWFALLKERPRFRAVQRDGRVSVTITSAGTSIGAGCTVSWKGIATVHEDRATVRWLLPQLGRRIGIEDADELETWVRVEDSPTRVLISVEPTTRVSFDIRKRKERTVEALAAQSSQAAPSQ
jgi:general stress protein 26